MYIESHYRAIIKTASWRILATFITGLLVYLFVGRIDIAAFVGGAEMITKLVVYYTHERIWNRFNFGKMHVEPFVLWFTGLSGSGKSTLANKLYSYIKDKGYRIERLDGDTVREIFPQTGFSKEERDSHVKRVGYIASMLEKNGVIVVSSFISPYQEARDFVRGLCKNFIEVHVSTSLEECERRDIKGLYAKARNGEIKHFTGISDPYEPPRNPEISVDTEHKTIEQCFQYIVKELKKKNGITYIG